MLLFVLPLFAADSEYKLVRVDATADRINVRLPLTDVTGKVRVKHRNPGGIEEPVAPLQTKLDDSDYLEWQIGYDTLDPYHPSLATGVRFQRRGLTKLGCELSKILVDARRIGLINDDQLRRERDFLATIRDKNFEETAKLNIEKASSPNEPLPDGFDRLVEEIPMFSKETPHGRIEIQLKPKQRAVGMQAMVYVCLNMRDLRDSSGSPRATARAHAKEMVLYRFDKTNTDLLFDIIRAFGMASRQSNEDVSNILACVIGAN